MLRIYAVPNSRSNRAVWTLEEIGIDYELVPVDLGQKLAEGKPFTDINPGGKVPTLVEDGWVLTESAAICTYLADQHPEAQLTPPAGTRERARYDQWCFFVLSELEQALWTKAKHRFALPEEWRIEAIKEVAIEEFRLAEAVLAKGLGDQSFILGEQFSVADILIGTTLNWAEQGEEIHLSHDNLKAYRKRLNARPALTRTLTRAAA